MINTKPHSGKRGQRQIAATVAPVSAQPETPGRSDLEADRSAGSRFRPGSEITVNDEAVDGPREPGEAPDVSVLLDDDGRSVRVGPDDVLVPAEPVADGLENLVETSTIPASPRTKRESDADSGEVDAGFVAGESEYQGAEGDGYRHVWYNPDGTITVIYAPFPSVADPDTGELVEDRPVLGAPERGRIDASNDRVEVSIDAVADEIPERVERTPTVRPEGRAPLVTVGRGESEIGFSVPGQTRSTGEVADGVVVFTDAVGSTDLEIEPLSTGFKFTYVVDSADHALKLYETVELPDGWSFKQGNGLVEFFDTDGAYAGVWAGGTAHDAKQDFGDAEVRIEVVEENGRSITARVVVDEKWLSDPARAYPVRIDPTFSSYPEQDTWIGANVSTPMPNDNILQLGTNGGSERRALLEFEAGFANDTYIGLPVASANLFLAPSYTGSCNSQVLAVRRATTAWNANTVVWSTQPGSVSNGDADVSFTNCSNNYRGFPVTNIVKHWSDNPGTNHGFLVHMYTGAPYRSMYSKDYSNSSRHPLLQVTYNSPPVYGAEYQTQTPAGAATPHEALLPTPGTTGSPGTDGEYPVQLTNTGAQNWPSGKSVSHPNATGTNVCLAYHSVPKNSSIPPAGGWTNGVFDGKRTCPDAGASNMSDYWAGIAAGIPPGNLQAQPFVGLLAKLNDTDHGTAGEHDVYFSMVHEGVTWFEYQGVAMADKVTVRWTDPPAVTAPSSGGVYSAAEDVGFTWQRPHHGTSAAWTPTQYRLRIYDNGSNKIHEEILAGTITTASVTAAELNNRVGGFAWTLQARDGGNEIANGTQHWTQAESGTFFIQPASLGDALYGENFAGVNPAGGNVHLPTTDLAVASVTPGLEIVRHYNSLDTTRGIFGQGFTTKWEMSFNCAAGCTYGTPGPRVLNKADGSTIYFDYNTANSRWEATDGSEAFATRSGSSSAAVFKVEFKDGSFYEFKRPPGGGYQHGDLSRIVDAAGRQFTVSTHPSWGYPTKITDEESGRSINIDYQIYPGPQSPTSRAVSKIWSGTSGTAAYREVNFSYTYSYGAGGWATGWLDSVCEPAPGGGFYCQNYDWNAGGKVSAITWTNTDRRTDINYTTDGRAQSVINRTTRPGGPVTSASTSFTYNNLYTVINDGRSNNWRVDFNDFKYTMKVTDPVGGETSYTYDDHRRTTVTDGENNTATLVYDSAGNLLEQENAAGNTSYYRYTSATAPEKPSHSCDTRSASSVDNTYCTLFTYDTSGNKLSERQPGESAAQAEEWQFSAGTEAAVGGGTIPKGLLLEHRTAPGNAPALYLYASNGDLKQVTDPAGLVTKYNYDALGRVTSEIDVADGVTTTVRTVTYNSTGTIATETGPAVVNPITSQTHQQRTVYTWDSLGQMTIKVIDDINTANSARRWTYAYDAMGRVITAEDPEAYADGPTGPAKAVQTTYDANGNTTSVTDANGNQVTTTYDSRNLANITTAVAFNDGHGTVANRTLTDLDWYDNGLLKSTKQYTSATASITETHLYDPAGRLTFTTITETPGTGTVQVMANVYHPSSGLLTSTTEGDVNGTGSSDNATTTYTYDTAGRIAAATTEGDRKTEYQYDPVGNITVETMTGDYINGGSTLQTIRETRTTYNSASLPTVTTIENGSEDLTTTTTSYTDHGQPETIVSPRGNASGATAADYTTTIAYDRIGRPITTTSPTLDVEYAGTGTGIEANWQTTATTAVTKVGYDAFGNTTHSVDANNNTTITTFDRNERRTGVTHPTYTPPTGSTVTPTESWTYDGNGNTTSYTSRNGNTTNYVFDSANQPVAQTDPAIPTPADDNVMQTRGATHTWYDRAGRVIQTRTPEGAVTAYLYDLRSRVITTTQAVRAVGGQPAQTAVTGTVYSGLGYITQITDPEGVITTTSYNPFGEALSTQVGSLTAATNIYDGAGRPTRSTNPDGSYVITTYDQADRVLSTSRYGSDNTLAEQITNTYDADGNLETTTDARGGQTAYTYDPAGRLTDVTQTVSLSDTITTSYAYDKAGNQTRLIDGEANSTRYVYNVWNLPEITLEPSAGTSFEAEATRRWTMSYDAAGQTVHEAHPGGRVVTRTFNALGLPEVETSTESGATTVAKTWGYDRMQRPVRLSHPTSPIVFTYDDRGLLVTQTGGAGDASFTYDEASRPLTRTDEAGTRGFTYTNNGQVDTVFDGAPPAGPGRVTGTVAEYVFAGGTGTTVADVSGEVPAMDLTIVNPANTTWSADGLSINQATKLQTSGAATRVSNAISTSGEVTLEAWVDPANLTQSGPARIISISSGAYLRNTTLGQQTDEIDMRVRATGTSTNGVPTFRTTNSPLDTELVHIVATHDAAGNEVIYADGVVQSTWSGAGTIANWDSNYKLLIANETSNDRAWLGEICLAAVYDEALSAAEVQQNYTAGCPVSTSSGSGGGSGAWSIDYTYDTAGRLTGTEYAGDGATAVTYDNVGRVATETIVNASDVTTASTAYHYDCVGQVIAKDTDLAGNTGDGLNAYTYDLAGRLTSWNNQATAVPPTCPGTGGGSSRVDTGLIAEYLFSDQISGTTVPDTSGETPALDLTIANPANTTWTANGLSIDQTTILSTAGAATRMANAINTSDALTLEAWVDPANLTQSGPARIITNSSGGYLRNTTLGQQGDEIDFRVRAANTSNNGFPTLRTSNDALDTELVHLVATHDASGNQVIYADGQVQTTWNAGVINTFDTSYKLYVGNESSNDRAWLGEICLAAVYDKALTATEVTQNYSAGCPQTTGGGESPPSGVIYTYDDAGNRLTAGTDTFTYDNRNRLTSDPDGTYAWDPAGTLATYTPTSGPAETYTFDAAARLTDITDGATTTSYGYDSLDRITTRDSAAFTYAGAELDPTSDGNDSFHRDPAGRLLAYDTGTVVTHAATDGHNDLYGLINPDGTISDTATYDPYGEPIATTGTTDPVLGYQTDYTDPDTGHVWMGARWYQPSSATFLSRDTYAGELTTPFTLNRYTYAINNPMRYWDPDGNRSADTSEYRQKDCVAKGDSRADCHEREVRNAIAHGGANLSPSEQREAVSKHVATWIAVEIALILNELNQIGPPSPVLTAELDEMIAEGAERYVSPVVEDPNERVRLYHGYFFGMLDSRLDLRGLAGPYPQAGHHAFPQAMGGSGGPVVRMRDAVHRRWHSDFNSWLKQWDQVNGRPAHNNLSRDVWADSFPLKQRQAIVGAFYQSRRGARFQSAARAFESHYGANLPARTPPTRSGRQYPTRPSGGSGAATLGLLGLFADVGYFAEVLNPSPGNYFVRGTTAWEQNCGGPANPMGGSVACTYWDTHS